MDLELTEKVALVTGASRGTGFAIARALKREGATVAINARESVALAEAGRRLNASAAVAADVVDPIEARRLVDEVGACCGRLDILVCNAGSGQSVAPGSETPAEWKRMLDINFFAATNMIEAARPVMAAQGGGVIVCISSICGSAALGAPVTYSVAKAGLDMAIRGLSRPLAGEGIRLVGVAPGNLLVPGGVWARKLSEDPAGVEAMLAREVALARFGSPEEIADVVCFLASARAAFVTGEVLVADGGQLRA